MAEITGGELKYVATIDTTQLDANLLNSEGKLKGFSEIADLTGQQLDNVVKGDVVANLKKLGLQSTLTGKDMKNAIKDVEEYVKGMEQGFKDAVDYQKELKKEISKLEPGDAQKKLMDEYLEIEKEMPGVVKAIEDAKNIVASFKEENVSLNTKLKAVREEMQQLVLIGQQDSKKYDELKNKAVEYQAAIDQVNSELKSLGGNQALNAVVESIGVASGVFATAQGVMGLFVGENENLDRIMVKMQSTMSVAIGLQQLQNSLEKESTFNVKVLTRAKELWALATGRVSTALRAMGASEAVATTGATTLLGVISGGLLLAIPVLIYAFDKFSEKQKEQAELNKKIADSVAEPLVAYRELQSQWNKLGDDIQAKNKFIEENKDSFNKLGFEVNGVNDAENLLVKQTSSVVEALMLRARAAAYKEKAIEYQKKAIEGEEETQHALDERKRAEGNIWKENLVRLKEKIGIIPTPSLDYVDDEAKVNEYIEKEAEALKAASKKLSAVSVKEIDTTKGNNNSSKSGSSSKRTPQKVADEYLPLGSVAEIQKRMQKIDEALSKSNDEKSITELTKRKLATMIELAEAEKQIAVQSQQEQIDFTKKTIDTRDQLIKAGFSKELVDKIYPEVKDTTFLDYLKNAKKELETMVSNGGGEKAAEDLKMVNEELERLYGKQSESAKFTQATNEALSQLPTLIQQIEYLQNQRDKQNSEGVSDGKYAFLNGLLEDKLKQQKEVFQSILDEQKSFEQKSIELEKEYQANLLLAGDDAGKIKKVNKYFSERAIKLWFNEMQNNPEWNKVFTDMNEVATNNLIKFREILVSKLRDAKNEADKIKIGEFIKKLDEEINKRNFLPSFTRLIGILGDKSLSTAEKIKKGKEEIKKFQKQLQYAGEIVNGVNDLFIELGGSSDSAFGDIIANTQKSIQGLQQFGEGALQALEGFASGNIIQGVAGGIKAIVGLVKSVSGWVNGDRKKERQIKKWAAAVSELKVQYQELEHAVSKALGEDKYKIQEKEIQNLKKQAQIIKKMRAKESDKKKADKGKIAEYNSQIQSINQQIEEIKDNIVKNILQTDATDAADKLGDALVEAFAKGEDASKAMRKTANSMIQDIVKNALKMRLEKAMQPLLDKLMQQVGFTTAGPNDEKITKKIAELEKLKKSLGNSFLSKIKKQHIDKIIKNLKAQLGGVSGSFSGLTPEQIEEFKTEVEAIGVQGQQFLNAYQELFQGLDSSHVDGLKGDIKGITEKTAGALEAQINAMRIKQVETANFTRDILLNIIQIEVNTRKLHNMDKNLSELNSKVNNGLAGL